MNESDDKSMDDVLASIRRIVRPEKEGAVTTPSGEGPRDEEPGPASDIDEPLVLTPEMRTDAGGAESGAGAELAADMSVASDREALRATVRELLRDELSGGPAEDVVRGIIRDELTSGQVGTNISRNVLRMVREELSKAVQSPR